MPLDAFGRLWMLLNAFLSGNHHAWVERPSWANAW